MPKACSNMPQACLGKVKACLRHTQLLKYVLSIRHALHWMMCSSHAWCMLPGCLRYTYMAQASLHAYLGHALFCIGGLLKIPQPIIYPHQTCLLTSQSISVTYSTSGIVVLLTFTDVKNLCFSWHTCEFSRSVFTVTTAISYRLLKLLRSLQDVIDTFLGWTELLCYSICHFLEVILESAIWCGNLQEW